MASSPVGTVAIVGIGLIGGSLAAAWREAGYAARIVGVEPDEAAASFALANGLVDELADAVPPDAALVAVCTPSDRVAEVVRELGDLPATLFDVGSVKGAIVAELGDNAPSNFVPCHPIAGSEKSGPEAARADLFRDATIVLAPGSGVPAARVDEVARAWAAVGGRCVRLDAQAHDRLLAQTSHLPHLLAFAFMAQVEEETLAFTGGGFRDFTRIAAANPELWWRILSMNKAALTDSAEAFRADLERLPAAIASDDKDAGIKLLTEAARLRQRLDGET